MFKKPPLCRPSSIWPDPIQHSTAQRQGKFSFIDLREGKLLSITYYMYIVLLSSGCVNYLFEKNSFILTFSVSFKQQFCRLTPINALAIRPANTMAGRFSLS